MTFFFSSSLIVGPAGATGGRLDHPVSGTICGVILRFSASISWPGFTRTDASAHPVLHSAQR